MIGTMHMLETYFLYVIIIKSITEAITNELSNKIGLNIIDALVIRMFNRNQNCL